jgi:hypothetical protein
MNEETKFSVYSRISLSLKEEGNPEMCYGMNHEDIKLSEVNQYKKHILHDST